MVLDMKMAELNNLLQSQNLSVSVSSVKTSFFDLNVFWKSLKMSYQVFL